MFTLLSKLFRFFGFFIVTSIFVLFALENKEKVTLTLYPAPYSLEITKYGIVLFAFFIGYVFAIVHGILLLRRQRSVTREYKTQNNSLENELKKLKSQLAEGSTP